MVIKTSINIQDNIPAAAETAVVINACTAKPFACKALPALNAYDPAVLSEVIQCAAEPSVSLAKVDGLIDDPETDIEKLFTDVLKELSEANAVKLAAKKLKI